MGNIVENVPRVIEQGTRNIQSSCGSIAVRDPRSHYQETARLIRLMRQHPDFYWVCLVERYSNDELQQQRARETEQRLSDLFQISHDPEAFLRKGQSEFLHCDQFQLVTEAAACGAFSHTEFPPDSQERMRRHLLFGYDNQARRIAAHYYTTPDDTAKNFLLRANYRDDCVERYRKFMTSPNPLKLLFPDNP